MSSTDAMSGREFEYHVAELLRLDGGTDVVVRGECGDRGAGITGCAPDGRHVAVQYKRFAPDRSITSSDVQKFVGAAKVLHVSEVVLFVATCPFTREVLKVATAGGVTAVHRGLLKE
ncbi:restriction endonuclease [Streptomyces justiciae]|uniref:restriction endonuclease n=1 Tax=Streptomyces justiciae TaxID=2780140 RepID=UPI002117E732|nr:restriction endonuclease [Streptomyces justiciae]MCW8377245.1 restriction endonuclease [Streptomyces justiciae]